LALVADLSVSQLQHNHMQMRIDAKAAEGKITAGNRLKANFSTFSQWLFQQGYSETDLSARLVKAGKERPREVVLSVEEVQAIWRALDGLSGPFASAFRLLILTGQRGSGPVSVSCLCGGYSLLPCGVRCLSLGGLCQCLCVGEDTWSPVWGRSPFTVWRAIFSGALGVSDCARCVGRVKDCEGDEGVNCAFPQPPLPSELVAFQRPLSASVWGCASSCTSPEALGGDCIFKQERPEAAIQHNSLMLQSQPALRTFAAGARFSEWRTGTVRTQLPSPRSPLLEFRPWSLSCSTTQRICNPEISQAKTTA
jgi:hypothetical protein